MELDMVGLEPTSGPRLHLPSHIYTILLTIGLL